MSIDPNHELNPIFADDIGDAFNDPEQAAASSPGLGDPDMRGVVRREPPGVAPADATTGLVDDPGVSLPNAGRADRGAHLESPTARSVVPEERIDPSERDVDLSDRASTNDQSAR